MPKKFSDNLNKLSYATNQPLSTPKKSKTLKEWKYIETIKLEPDNKVKCLCTAYIYAEVNTFYNRFNGNFAYIGSSCKNKFPDFMEIKKKEDKKVKQPRGDYFNRFIKYTIEFGNINDILEYSEDAKNKLFETISNDIDNNIEYKNTEMLQDILDKLNYFEKNLIILNHTNKDIMDKINILITDIRKFKEKIQHFIEILEIEGIINYIKISIENKHNQENRKKREEENRRIWEQENRRKREEENRIRREAENRRKREEENRKINEENKKIKEEQLIKWIYGNDIETFKSNPRYMLSNKPKITYTDKITNYTKIINPTY